MGGGTVGKKTEGEGRHRDSGTLLDMYLERMMVTKKENPKVGSEVRRR